MVVLRYVTQIIFIDNGALVSTSYVILGHAIFEFFFGMQNKNLGKGSAQLLRFNKRAMFNIISNKLSVGDENA